MAGPCGTSPRVLPRPRVLPELYALRQDIKTRCVCHMYGMQPYGLGFSLRDANDEPIGERPLAWSTTAS